MADKPSGLEKIWAETGGITAPDDAKISIGWEAEIPPFQYMNYVLNKHSKMARHINEEGIPVYDILTDYPIAAYVKGSDGVAYKAEIVNGPDSTAVDPVGDSTGTWKPAFRNAVDTMAELGTVNTIEKMVFLMGFHTPGDLGAGHFIWSATEDKANHNGGTIIDPDITFPSDWTDQVQVTTWLTVGTGTGCWIRTNRAIIDIQHFGAVAVGGTAGSNRQVIQKAWDTSFGSNGSNANPVCNGVGDFEVDSTLYMYQGPEYYGGGNSLSGVRINSRISLEAGAEVDLIRIANPNLTGSSYWAAMHIHDMDFRGDVNGSLGSGLVFKDSAGNLVVPQDSTRLYGINTEYFSEDGMVFPKGGVPFHIRDVRTSFNKGYGVSITGAATLAVGIDLDNISGDDNRMGLILLKDLDATANVVLTNTKSENRTSTYQQNVIVCDNCDRTSIVINGGHNTGVQGIAPKNFFHIIGTGVPIIIWNGYAPRIYAGDTDIALSNIVNDTVSGRTIPANQRSGGYNLVNAHRYDISGATLANGSGTNANCVMDTVDELSNGDIVVGTQMEDMADVFCGEAVFTGETEGQNIYFRRHNKSGALFDYTPASILAGFRVPSSWTKARGVSAAFNPPQIVAPGNTFTTVSVPSAQLGDFCLITHPINQDSTILSSYVSTDDTVTVVWAAVVGTRDVGTADLTAYVLKEDELNLIGAYSIDPPSIAHNAQYEEEVTLEGVAIGDAIAVSFNLDLQYVSVFAYVSAADTVRILFLNLSGGAIDLGAGVLRLGVLTK